jgi:hypothetical protein
MAMSRRINEPGARFEIAIDGTPLYASRSQRAGDRGGETFLKTKQPHAEITVRDVETGEMTSMKHLLQK